MLDSTLDLAPPHDPLVEARLLLDSAVLDLSDRYLEEAKQLSESFEREMALYRDERLSPEERQAAVERAEGKYVSLEQALEGAQRVRDYHLEPVLNETPISAPRLRLHRPGLVRRVRLRVRRRANSARTPARGDPSESAEPPLRRRWISKTFLLLVDAYVREDNTWSEIEGSTR